MLAAGGGRTILDDCYNANPASMSAALAAVVAAVGGAGGWARAFAVLGDMLEVGPESEELHRALGREAGVRLAGVVALGDFAARSPTARAPPAWRADRTQVAALAEEAAAAMASLDRAGRLDPGEGVARHAAGTRRRRAATVLAPEAAD